MEQAARSWRAPSSSRSPRRRRRGSRRTAWRCVASRRGHGRAEAPLNLLLVTLDTTRADHLGCYGYARARTRHLDRLAAEGVRFEQAP